MAQQQYYGTTATSIRIAEPGDSSDLQRISIRPGDTITVENIRASIQALYDTGRYRYIEVDATEAEGGTVLTFRVQLHYYFSTFRLEPPDLLDRSLSAFFRIPIGEKFSTAQVERIVEEAKQLLEDQGYFNATITPEVVFEEPTKLAHVTLNAQTKEQAEIGSIQLQGGEQTFSHEELLDTFDISTGDEFLADLLSEAAGRIREDFTELGFLNTRVDVQRAYNPATNTVDIQVTVEPGQFTLVQTRGYDISEKEVRTLVPVFEEGTVDPDLVEEGRIRLQEYMQQRGFFEAMVRAEVIEAPLDNAVQINYVIDPAEQHRIRSIRIEGNEFFSDEELRQRMQVKGAGMFNRGAFSPEILNEDIRTIQALYRETGFEGTEVKASQAERENAVDVIIEIVEGKRRPIDYFVFIGQYAIPETELRKAISVKEGELYSEPLIEEAHNALINLYYSRGFSEVRVDHLVERAQNNGGVRVTFQIVEGESYQIGTIVVAGNTLTAEKIVHRNSRLYPNTPFNPEAILEAQQRLYATGLFNRVEIVVLDEGENRVRNLLIQLEDAKPIQLSYGLGLMEYEGFRGTVEITHNNLFGLARAISVRVRGSRTDRQFQSTYREPKLFNRDIEGYASLYIEKAQELVYDINRIDFSFQALRRINEQTSFLFLSSYQTVNLQDIRVVPATRRTKDLEGIIQIARLGGSLVQDRRDDAISPQTGSFATTSFQVASKALGSEVNFTSLFNQTTHYMPLAGSVLATSARVGWNQPYGGDRELPISERYFAGGSTTLRGFDLDEAGPPGGGQLLSIGNIELRKPLNFVPIAGVGGVLFYDTGNVFERPSDFSLSNFTHTAGFGLRYETPLGPVRFDVGFNLHPKTRIRNDGSFQRDERVQVFFTLGNTF